MYDLVIKGGTVIDPAQNINKKMDIAISDGKIAAVAPDIALRQAPQIFDASRYIVTPGLIDAHCHVFHGINSLGADPDDVGIRQGVTTVLDAGSTGFALFDGFPNYIIPKAQTSVLCYLHVCSTGLSIMPELFDWSEINAGAIAATVEANRNLIRGIKIRLVGKLIAAHGIEVFKKAQEIARQLDLPLAMHIGDVERWVAGSLTKEFLPLMQPGDILTHVYTSQQGSIINSNWKVIPELKDAAGRGVLLDMAPGRFNFSYEIARRCMEEGIVPTVLGSDVVDVSLRDRLYGLTNVMSRLLMLGMKLADVIELSTIRNARLLGIEETKGSLKPGMDADISILELLSGKWDSVDAIGKTITLEHLIMPHACVKGGKLIPSKPVAVPKRRE